MVETKSTALSDFSRIMRAYEQVQKEIAENDRGQDVMSRVAELSGCPRDTCKIILHGIRYGARK